MFTKGFAKFACIGDSIECEIGEITFKARMESDFTTKPTDFDCYSEETIQAWKDDDWSYCGIVLSAHVGDMELLDFASALYGVEFNFPDSDNSNLLEVANQLLPEAIKETKVKIADMLESLSKVQGQL